MGGMRVSRWIRALGVFVGLALALSGAALGEQASVALSRDFSRVYAASGDWVTLSYTVSNDSQAAVSAVTVSDPLVGEVGYIARLEPGDQKVISVRVRVTEPSESSPQARYMLGEEVLSVSAPAESIQIESVAVSAVLSACEEDGQVRLMLTVCNQGSAPLYGVKAVSSVLGDMGGAIGVLQPGEERSLTRFARPDETTIYQCDVTATSSAGKSVFLRSNEIEWTPGAVREDGEVGVEVQPCEAETPGQLAFVLSVANLTGRELKDVVVRETTLGGERTLKFLPAGESAQMIWTCGVPEYDLTLCFQLTQDGAVLAEAAPLSATAAPDASAAEQGGAAEDGVPVPDGVSYRLDENSPTYRNMILYTLLILALILLVWWAVSTRRKYRERKMRIRRRREIRKKLRARKTEQKKQR